MSNLADILDLEPLRVVPLPLDQAKAFIAERHRHNKPPLGHKFSIGVMAGDRLVGVATTGRPVAQKLDDGTVAEITRVCTDGTRNACSMLYGAARRAALAMGYQRVITYTLPEEGGASLRAAGFRIDKANAGGPARLWHNRAGRKAEPVGDDTHGGKIRWVSP